MVSVWEEASLVSTGQPVNRPEDPAQHELPELWLRVDLLVVPADRVEGPAAHRVGVLGDPDRRPRRRVRWVRRWRALWVVPPGPGCVAQPDRVAQPAPPAAARPAPAAPVPAVPVCPAGPAVAAVASVPPDPAGMRGRPSPPLLEPT